MRLSPEIPDFQAQSFRRAWWLPGAHLQTLGARALRRAGGVPIRRTRVELPDGDFVDLDFSYPRHWDGRTDAPYVLLLHGLEGSAQSKYALETYRNLDLHGLRGVGLNFRSCSGELNRLPRLYHSGDTEDLAFTIAWLTARYPDRPFGVIGFSLGGNVLLKFLGERGSDLPAQLVSAVAISVPFDLGRGATHLKRLGGRVYVSYLLRKLQRKVVAKKQMLVDKIDYDRAVSARDFWEFDDSATAPLHGFAGADDYYQRSSSVGFLDAIQIRTLLLHAEDDPFLPSDCMPRDAAERNANLLANFTPAGGHVGFVSGSVPWRPVFWAEREAARFMRGSLRTG